MPLNTKRQRPLLGSNLLRNVALVLYGPRIPSCSLLLIKYGTSSCNCLCWPLSRPQTRLGNFHPASKVPINLTRVFVQHCHQAETVQYLYNGGFIASWII